MQGPVTLTGDEFKLLHNALYDFMCVNTALEGVINESLHKKLLKVRSDIKKSLEGAYTQEEIMFRESHEYFNNIREGMKFQTEWSIYEVKDLFAHHPFTDARYVSYSGDPVDIPGPRWIDLWIAADQAIRASGDQHHIYIESFSRKEVNPEMLFLVTGS